MRVIGDMGAFADELLARIGRARTRVDIECFIIRDDRLGQSLAAALSAAAARGVVCRVLYDPLGCRTTPRRFFQALAASGVAVRRFGWIGALVLGKLRRKPAARDHGRVIVIDDAAFTGGHAWGDEWLPAARDGQGWHDVCCGVEGPLVDDFAELFEQHWRQSLHETDIADYVGVPRDGRRLVSDAPVKRSVVLGRYLEAIAAARRRVWIANAYFYPPPSLLDALLEAGRRGVEVKIIVPGVSDVPFIRAAARAEYRRWMAAGLELWEYQRVVMHSKYALVDDAWCLIGTFNANVVSVAFAIEVALFSHDRADTSAVADQMLKDFASSRRVDSAWLDRMGFWRRLGNRIASWVMRAANLLLPRHPAPLPASGEGEADERVRVDRAL
ncbi:MAG TPA: phosphatidylserine/phosphatidylglycerophosphate/cardiolipin synthase family protein [Polyangia bacterium]|nr:phosphatidylserine/phosphatidylglycerophosphate/cardiolipin synthase family protein [Polyangia bacterium]